MLKHLGSGECMGFHCIVLSAMLHVWKFACKILENSNARGHFLDMTGKKVLEAPSTMTATQRNNYHRYAVVSLNPYLCHRNPPGQSTSPGERNSGGQASIESHLTPEWSPREPSRKRGWQLRHRAVEPVSRMTSESEESLCTGSHPQDSLESFLDCCPSRAVLTCG